MFFRACMFMSYGQSKDWVRRIHGVKHMGAIDYFFAGAIGWGVFGALVECPIDFYKSQLQFQIIKSKSIPGYVPEFTGVADAAKKIIKANGLIRGSYQV